MMLKEKTDLGRQLAESIMDSVLQPDSNDELMARVRQLEQERDALQHKAARLQSRSEEFKFLLKEQASSLAEAQRENAQLRRELSAQQVKLARLEQGMKSTHLVREKSRLMGAQNGYPVEMVTWVTTAGTAQRWHSLDDKPKVLTVRTCGFVTYEDDEIIRITPHILPGKTQGCGDMKIPKQSIRSRLPVGLMESAGSV